MKENMSIYKIFPAYYAEYSDGSRSVSFQSLHKAAAWKIYYENKHPGEKVTIIDEDGYIVSTRELLEA